jgi:DNA repair exonuclease SbcCD ATPase subunit
MIALKRVKLEGFRGAKRPLDLRFSNPIVLAGHSGSGKTSILQAIEWGLFGKILGFKGYGFMDEDAYVNIF